MPRENVDALHEYLPTLLAWGFLRRVATVEGSGYEVTEMGSSILGMEFAIQ